jgi:hypothetical protein
VLARPEPGRPGYYLFTIVRDAEVGLNAIDPDDPPMIFSIRNFVSDAMGLEIMSLKRGGDSA